MGRCGGVNDSSHFGQISSSRSSKRAAKAYYCIDCIAFSSSVIKRNANKNPPPNIKLAIFSLYLHFFPVAPAVDFAPAISLPPPVFGMITFGSRVSGFDATIPPRALAVLVPADIRLAAIAAVIGVGG